MTVSYQRHLAHSRSGGFARLLFKWRGSLYKLIYRELLLFIIVYGIVSFVYQNLLCKSSKDTFDKVVVYCAALEKLIPLSFILGFYVTYILQRWWSQFKAIPWPDPIMHLLLLYVAKKDEYGRMMLRSLMRYVNLTLILVMRSISINVKRRFPNLQDLVNAGLMTKEEVELFESVPNSDITTYWIPSTWFIQLLQEGHQNKHFTDDRCVGAISKEFNLFRSQCDLLWSYDWLPIPLVYTQVVTIVTYGYFLIILIGRQCIDGTEVQHLQIGLDRYISILSVFEILFFLGLLKVAEQLINPCGDDEEDFELNWLIDRHVKVSWLGVDMIMKRRPTLVKDCLWDVEDISLPYPPGAEYLKGKTYYGGVAHKKFSTPGDTIVSLPDKFSEKQNDVTVSIEGI